MAGAAPGAGGRGLPAPYGGARHPPGDPPYNRSGRPASAWRAGRPPAGTGGGRPSQRTAEALDSPPDRAGRLPSPQHHRQLQQAAHHASSAQRSSCAGGSQAPAPSVLPQSAGAPPSARMHRPRPVCHPRIRRLRQTGLQGVLEDFIAGRQAAWVMMLDFAHRGRGWEGRQAGLPLTATQEDASIVGLTSRMLESPRPRPCVHRLFI